MERCKNEGYKHFAFDEHKLHLVNIQSAANNRGKKFYCPYCKQEMITKCGAKRRWHFAHKVLSDRCTYDKYLHSLAEILIENWYNGETKIILEYNIQKKCGRYRVCPWDKDSDCSTSETKPYNLKAHFKRCEKEVRYHSEKNGDDFVADLYLQHDTSGIPIFIEVYVTHKCEEKKIKSGIRIIEIKIKSEEDILRLIQGNTISENLEMTEYYNFKPKEEAGRNFPHRLRKFVVFSSGKAYINEKSWNCDNFNTKHDGVYEITFNAEDFYHDSNFYAVGGLYPIAIAKAKCDGAIEAHCLLCKYHSHHTYEGNICNLYKKFQTAKACRDNDANSCQYYRLDENFYRGLLSLWSDYSKKNHVEIWKP